MNTDTHEHSGRRTPAARVGVAALNLLAPGLGLARLGNWRGALPFLAAPFVLILLVTFGMGHFPITSYGRVLLTLVVILGLAAALYLIPIVLTWRESRLRSAAHGWSRWYGLTAIAIAVLIATQVAVAAMHRVYKPFYAPSESMAPTIGKGDKFIADMRWRGPLRRGEIILFNGPDGIRVSRIAAVAGDRIAMHSGLPVVNGHQSIQSLAGQTSFLGYDGVQPARMLTERLPGKAATHRVLDTGSSDIDETQEVSVPAGHVFVLGDNRD